MEHFTFLFRTFLAISATEAIDLGLLQAETGLEERGIIVNDDTVKARSRPLARPEAPGQQQQASPIAT
jgi:hypothetical protein